MKKLLAALVLVMLAATVGCFSGPQVDKGGGESAVLEQLNGKNTGRIDVQGHVVNTGGTRALNVELFFTFFQDGTVFQQEKLRIGTMSAGTSKSFSGTFFGPPVTGVFTWEYRIEWD